jgi:hypothetical protein
MIQVFRQTIHDDSFFDRSNSFVPADNLPKNGPLRTIHDSPGFDRFIQDCLHESEFYRYADPLADVIINVAEQGNGFPWHFDTNNFTVTLAIQNADEGGAFEYARGIREGDENFAEVSRVLNGNSDKVKALNLEPGDLQIFRGRYSLHQVAPLKGARPRDVAIFSYVGEPNMVGAPERTMQLYGRTLPIHHERVGQRSDAYLDSTRDRSSDRPSRREYKGPHRAQRSHAAAQYRITLLRTRRRRARPRVCQNSRLGWAVGGYPARCAPSAGSALI